MNRLVLIFSALALFAACEKYEDEIVPDVIFASLPEDGVEPLTRTYAEGHDVLWLM